MTHFTIYDWMIDELHLKGAELNTFALIQSFSTANQECNGSINYICKRTGATSKTTVVKALKSLVDKKYITKIETGKDERGYAPNVYKSNYDKDGNPITKNGIGITKNGIGKEKNSKKEVESITENVTPYTKKCNTPITKNGINNKDNIEIDNKKYTYADFSKEVDEIFNHMNKTFKSTYSAQEEYNNRNLIDQLATGKYTVDDFKLLIDAKYNDWHNTRNSVYLNPTALFGTSFDRLLNNVKLNKSLE